MKKKLFLLLITVLLFTAPGANAQRGYTEFETEDDLAVMYRWQRAKFYLKDSDAVLNLRVTNSNESAVKWTFAVGFYDGGRLLYQSEENELCLKPGQSRRGGLAGLRFSLEDMKLDAVEQESFSWDFVAYDVEKVENCE